MVWEQHCPTCSKVFFFCYPQFVLHKPKMLILYFIFPTTYTVSPQFKHSSNIPGVNSGFVSRWKEVKSSTQHSRKGDLCMFITLTFTTDTILTEWYFFRALVRHICRPCASSWPGRWKHTLEYHRVQFWFILATKPPMDCLPLALSWYVSIPTTISFSCLKNTQDKDL